MTKTRIASWRRCLIAAASAVAAGLVILSASNTTQASETCGYNAQVGGNVCVAGISSDRIAHVQAVQEKDQWCWAASISMIFNFYDMDVSQQAIVKEMYGAIVNMPGDGTVLTDALNREWTDENGDKFEVEARVTDLMAREWGVNNDAIIDELRAGRPVLAGINGHAMVLTAITYIEGAGIILGATVRDPWPGRGRRDLQRHEMYPTYVAAIGISDLEDDDSSAEDASGNDDAEETADDGVQLAQSGEAESYCGFVDQLVGAAASEFDDLKAAGSEEADDDQSETTWKGTLQFDTFSDCDVSRNERKRSVTFTYACWTESSTDYDKISELYDAAVDAIRDCKENEDGSNVDTDGFVGGSSASEYTVFKDETNGVDVSVSKSYSMSSRKWRAWIEVSRRVPK